MNKNILLFHTISPVIDRYFDDSNEENFSQEVDQCICSLCLQKVDSSKILFLSLFINIYVCACVYVILLGHGKCFELLN